MPRSIPDDVGEWLAVLRKQTPVELSTDEKRGLNDLLNGILYKVLVHLAQGECARYAASESLSPMESSGAAEIARLQGGRREFAAMIETLWEMADENAI
ncbi:MAG: hypothetical protein C0436_04975 [Alphaproteobacteria bacterium]|nr:hypothetical protein [Alphaproteobacteria bacterium]